MNQAEIDFLVLSAQSGNQQAFNLLFEYYLKALVVFANRISNDHELAKDAVQDAMLNVAKTIRQIRDPRYFRSWIYRKVRWSTLDLLRRKHSEISRSESFNEQLHDPEIEVHTDNHEQLHQAIRSLDEVDKQIIHLFYLDELKINEIAAILEIPGGTVKSRLNRARNTLKKIYLQLENEDEI